MRLSTMPGMGLVALLVAPALVEAQAIASDVATPEAIVVAAYESLRRAPGEPFQWDRFRSLFLPGAVMIPNTEQTGGAFRMLSVGDFVAWIDGWTAETAPIGGPTDKGFVEVQIHAETNRYGDVAQVMSTYVKHFWGDEQVLGRGINSFQLVQHDGRWWIVSVAWDEENGAGPIPDLYLPSRS